LYLGGHYLINNSSDDYYSSHNTKDKHLIFGGGPAVEFLPGQGRFSINFMVGYGADINWYEDSYSYNANNSENSQTDYRIGLQGGLYLFYRL
jgi:hypothetical protein